MSDLERFRKAQEHPSAGFQAALAELRAGRKSGHWIWYIFPQLAGLGSSRTSQAHGIRSISEAADYLRDPLLQERLLTITSTVAEHIRAGVPLTTLMGWSVDAVKLVSSLTLFGNVAKTLYTVEKDGAYRALSDLADEILSTASTQGYPPCRHTLTQLGLAVVPSRPRSDSIALLGGAPVMTHLEVHLMTVDAPDDPEVVLQMVAKLRASI